MGGAHIFGLPIASVLLSAMSLFVRWRFPKVPHYISSVGFAVAVGTLMAVAFPNLLRPGTWTGIIGALACLAFAIEWQLAAPTSARSAPPGSQAAGSGADLPPSPEPIPPKPPPFKQVGVNLTVVKPSVRKPSVVRAGGPPTAPPTASSAPSTAGRDAYVNNGVNNGIMGPVSIGKPEFQLTTEMIQSVIDAAPKGVPIAVRSVGGSRATDMGDEIAAALRAQDYDVKRVGIGVMMPAPEQPLTVRRTPEMTIVTVDPAAQP